MSEKLSEKQEREARRLSGLTMIDVRTVRRYLRGDRVMPANARALKDAQRPRITV